MAFVGARTIITKSIEFIIRCRSVQYKFTMVDGVPSLPRSQQIRGTSKPAMTEPLSYQENEAIKTPKDHQATTSNLARLVGTAHMSQSHKQRQRLQPYPAQRKPHATMPRDPMPWRCKGCELWCHSEMECCPKCFRKNAPRFPLVDSSNSVGGGTSEIGTGGVQPRGSEGVRDGREDDKTVEGG